MNPVLLLVADLPLAEALLPYLVKIDESHTGINFGPLGWAPIMVVLLLVGGFLMLMLGIIGEYLWRILDEIRGKPLFLIDHTAGRSGTTIDK